MGPLIIFVAIGLDPKITDLESILTFLGFSKSKNHQIASEGFWEKGSIKLFIGIGRFAEWASLVEVGLANAGTATEQLAGLGIPALSLPGKGPQFKKSFAFRQSRLLGGSVIPCKTPLILSQRLELLLRDRNLCSRIGKIGISRMGPKGGSDALAGYIDKLLFRT